MGIVIQVVSLLPSMGKLNGNSETDPHAPKAFASSGRKSQNSKKDKNQRIVDYIFGEGEFPFSDIEEFRSIVDQVQPENKTLQHNIKDKLATSITPVFPVDPNVEEITKTNNLSDKLIDHSPVIVKKNETHLSKLSGTKVFTIKDDSRQDKAGENTVLTKKDETQMNKQSGDTEDLKKEDEMKSHKPIGDSKDPKNEDEEKKIKRNRMLSKKQETLEDKPISISFDFRSYVFGTDRMPSNIKEAVQEIEMPRKVKQSKKKKTTQIICIKKVSDKALKFIDSPYGKMSVKIKTPENEISQDVIVRGTESVVNNSTEQDRLDNMIKSKETKDSQKESLVGKSKAKIHEAISRVSTKKEMQPLREQKTDAAVVNSSGTNAEKTNKVATVNLDPVIAKKEHQATKEQENEPTKEKIVDSPYEKVSVKIKTSLDKISQDDIVPGTESIVNNFTEHDRLDHSIKSKKTKESQKESFMGKAKVKMHEAISRVSTKKEMQPLREQRTDAAVVNSSGTVAVERNKVATVNFDPVIAKKEHQATKKQKNEPIKEKQIIKKRIQLSKGEKIQLSKGEGIQMSKEKANIIAGDSLKMKGDYNLEKSAQEDENSSEKTTKMNPELQLAMIDTGSDDISAKPTQINKPGKSVELKTSTPVYDYIPVTTENTSKSNKNTSINRMIISPERDTTRKIPAYGVENRTNDTTIKTVKTENTVNVKAETGKSLDRVENEIEKVKMGTSTKTLDPYDNAFLSSKLETDLEKKKYEELIPNYTNERSRHSINREEWVEKALNESIISDEMTPGENISKTQQDIPHKEMPKIRQRSILKLINPAPDSAKKSTCRKIKQAKTIEIQFEKRERELNSNSEDQPQTQWNYYSYAQKNHPNSQENDKSNFGPYSNPVEESNKMFYQFMNKQEYSWPIQPAQQANAAEMSGFTFGQPYQANYSSMQQNNEVGDTSGDYNYFVQGAKIDNDNKQDSKPIPLTMAEMMAVQEKMKKEQIKHPMYTAESIRQEYFKKNPNLPPSLHLASTHPLAPITPLQSGTQTIPNVYSESTQVFKVPKTTTELKALDEEKKHNLMTFKEEQDIRRKIEMIENPNISVPPQFHSTSTPPIQPIKPLCREPETIPKLFETSPENLSDRRNKLTSMHMHTKKNCDSSIQSITKPLINDADKITKLFRKSSILLEKIQEQTKDLIVTAETLPKMYKMSSKLLEQSRDSINKILVGPSKADSKYIKPTKTFSAQTTRKLLHMKPFPEGKPNSSTKKKKKTKNVLSHIQQAAVVTKPETKQKSNSREPMTNEAKKTQQTIAKPAICNHSRPKVYITKPLPSQKDQAAVLSKAQDVTLSLNANRKQTPEVNPETYNYYSNVQEVFKTVPPIVKDEDNTGRLTDATSVKYVEADILARSYEENIDSNIQEAIYPLPPYKHEEDIPLSLLLKTVRERSRLENIDSFMKMLENENLVHSAPPRPRVKQSTETRLGHLGSTDAPHGSSDLSGDRPCVCPPLPPQRYPTNRPKTCPRSGSSESLPCYPAPFPPKSPAPRPPPFKPDPCDPNRLVVGVQESIDPPESKHKPPNPKTV